jgi:hypothetical protein
MDIFLTIHDGDRMYVKVKFNKPVGTFEVASDVFAMEAGWGKSSAVAIVA